MSSLTFLITAGSFAIGYLVAAIIDGKNDEKSVKLKMKITFERTQPGPCHLQAGSRIRHRSLKGYRSQVLSARDRSCKVWVWNNSQLSSLHLQAGEAARQGQGVDKSIALRQMINNKASATLTVSANIFMRYVLSCFSLSLKLPGLPSQTLIMLSLPAV